MAEVSRLLLLTLDGLLTLLGVTAATPECYDARVFSAGHWVADSKQPHLARLVLNAAVSDRIRQLRHLYHYLKLIAHQPKAILCIIIIIIVSFDKRIFGLSKDHLISQKKQMYMESDKWKSGTHRRVFSQRLEYGNSENEHGKKQSRHEIKKSRWPNYESGLLSFWIAALQSSG